MNGIVSTQENSNYYCNIIENNNVADAHQDNDWLVSSKTLTTGRKEELLMYAVDLEEVGKIAALHVYKQIAISVQSCRLTQIFLMGADRKITNVFF